MYITYFGHSCFKLQDKTGSDAVTVVTDPFDKAVGIKVLSCEADIVTVSHDHHDHNNISALRGKPLVIDCAGEYDVKGIGIEGVESYHDEKEGAERGLNIIYRISMDDISIVHLGDVGHTLSPKQLDRLAGCDVLLIPVGGKYSLDSKKAVEVVSQLEPRIVIPMHYKAGESKMDIDGVDKFVKELGLSPRKEEKLKISKKELPQEDMELVVMSF